MTVTLEPMSLDLLDELALGDLAAAGRLVGRPLPPDFLDGQWVWQHFARRIREEPDVAWWLTQYLVLDAGRIVGHVRLFPPEQREAQIGWHVDPIHRGRAIAPTAAAQLASRASARGGVDRVVALIAHDNDASIRAAEKAGFVADGEQRHRFHGPMRRFVLVLAGDAR